MSVGGIAAEALRQGIERIERLEEEKKALSADIKGIYDQLGSQGFDKKVCRKIVNLRKMEPDERREEEQLIELYKAALGMNDDQPLSDPTRQRFSKPKPEEPAFDFDESEKESPPPPAPPPAEVSVEDARAMGRKAAEEGKPVTANPFPSGDPRRAAWDEEWCRAAGSDGMEIPAAWQRKTPKKPKKKDDK